MNRLRYILCLVSAWLALSLGVPPSALAQIGPQPAPPARPSSPLRAATSPFLARAATQAVQWRPWEGAAFRDARTQEKLVFLWIGASWCHWCHEMGRTAFKDPQVARILNESYVPVVVDRDLRPDVDRRYQRVVLTLSGRGGWPLVAVLTPSGDAVFGGGYFTARDDGGRPGLTTILTDLQKRWTAEREGMIAAARETTQRAIDAESQLSGSRATYGPVAPRDAASSPETARAAADQVVGAILSSYDPLHGGFGPAPRFPHAAALDLLLTWSEATGEDEALERALHTLSSMADGALRDPLTGLFFRYSVDDAWQHPGFEVLLSTNTDMLQVYLHAWQLTGRQRYKDVADELLTGILTTFGLPSGGFRASLGGEGAKGEEGGYFTWTTAELAALLTPDELEVVQARLGAEGESVLSGQPGAYVPVVARSVPEVARMIGRPMPETQSLLDDALAKMATARARRPGLRDDTLIVSWNARTASVLFEAQRALGRDDAGRAALKTVEIITHSVDPERTDLPHVLPPSQWAGMDLSSTRMTATLALLDAFENTGDPRWLIQAQHIMDGTLDRFWDPVAGGFFDIPEGASRNPLTASRWKDVVDGLLPSTNGLGIIALQRLGRWTGDARYTELAEMGLNTFAPVCDSLGLLGATWARAALHEADPPPVVVVASTRAPDAAPLVTAASRTFRPGTTVLQVGMDDLSTLAAYRLELPEGGDRQGPYAWVCSPEGCSAPVASSDALITAIHAHGRRGPPATSPVVRTSGR